MVSILLGKAEIPKWVQLKITYSTTNQIIFQFQNGAIKENIRIFASEYESARFHKRAPCAGCQYWHGAENIRTLFILC